MWKCIKPSINKINSIIKICEAGKLLSDGCIFNHARYLSQISNLRQQTTGSQSRNDILGINSVSNYLIDRRWYSKKVKDSGKKNKQAVKLDMNSPEVHEIINLEEMTSKMESAISYFQKELTEQLTLRVSLETVGAVMVETEDGNHYLSDIAQLQQKTAQLIIVNLAQYPQYASKAKAAIINSGINVTPQIEGTTLFLPIQKVTREHREKLAKSCKALCEKCKDKLRNIQNNYQKEVKGHKDNHSEDLIKNIQDYVLSQTKNFAAVADDVMAAKQKDIMNN